MRPGTTESPIVPAFLEALFVFTIVVTAPMRDRCEIPLYPRALRTEKARHRRTLGGNGSTDERAVAGVARADSTLKVNRADDGLSISTGDLVRKGGRRSERPRVRSLASARQEAAEAPLRAWVDQSRGAEAAPPLHDAESVFEREHDLREFVQRAVGLVYVLISLDV